MFSSIVDKVDAIDEDDDDDDAPLDDGFHSDPESENGSDSDDSISICTGTEFHKLEKITENLTNIKTII